MCVYMGARRSLCICACLLFQECIAPLIKRSKLKTQKCPNQSKLVTYCTCTFYATPTKCTYPQKLTLRVCVKALVAAEAKNYNSDRGRNEEHRRWRLHVFEKLLARGVDVNHRCQGSCNTYTLFPTHAHTRVYTHTQHEQLSMSTACAPLRTSYTHTHIDNCASFIEAPGS